MIGIITPLQRESQRCRTHFFLMRTLGAGLIAVGSGGSAVSAEFFARCRETLLSEITTVETPMRCGVVMTVAPAAHAVFEVVLLQE